MLHTGDVFEHKLHPGIDLIGASHDHLMKDVWKDWQSTGIFFKPVFPGLAAQDSLKLKAAEQLKPADRLTLDANCQPIKFNDRNDDKIEVRADGKWYRTNIINPAGEQLADFKADEQGNISITYQMPKDENDASKGKDYVQRQIRPDGSELTSYDTGTDNGKFTTAASSTLSTFEGTTKTMAVMNAKGETVQSLKFNGDDLVQFIAPDKTRFEATFDNAGKVNGWQKFSETNVAMPFKGDAHSVKANSNGEVIVRDELLKDKPEQDNGHKYATRFLPDGSKITSSCKSNDGSRVIVDSTDCKIDEEPHRAIVQEMPSNWKELLAERTAEAKDHPYEFLNITDALSFIKEKTQDSGDWDDKQKGGQFQAWGNVAWGVYASEMGFSYDRSIWYNGLAKNLNGKTNEEWGSPLDILNPFASESTYGQNPADAELIKRGYEYQAKIAAEQAADEAKHEKVADSRLSPYELVFSNIFAI
ncbi:hypothetical protein BH11CYA1_BH11CYA1_07390 [soil metagenome]